MIAIVIVVFGVLLLVGFVWREVTEQRRQRRHQRWIEQCGGSCAMALCRYLFDDGVMPHVECRVEPSAMWVLLHSVCSLSSGYSPRRVRDLVAHFGLEEYLRRQTLGGPQPRRAEYALMMAQTGLDLDIHPPRHTSNPFERLLYALSLSQLSDERSVLNNAARVSMSAHHLSLLVELRFRRFGAQEYRGALSSEEPQMIRLGLAAVRRFGDDRAVDDVRYLCDVRDDFLLPEALYTLFSLHAPIALRSVVRAFARLDEISRKRLYRFLVVEGYSTMVVKGLCLSEGSASLSEFALGLCESYKRRLDRPVERSFVL